MKVALKKKLSGVVGMSLLMGAALVASGCAKQTSSTMSSTVATAQTVKFADYGVTSGPFYSVEAEDCRVLDSFGVGPMDVASPHKCYADIGFGDDQLNYYVAYERNAPQISQFQGKAVSASSDGDWTMIKVEIPDRVGGLATIAINRNYTDYIFLSVNSGWHKMRKARFVPE
jgi:hypothetical protein